VPRRSTSLLVAAVTAGLLVGACGGTPSPSGRSDVLLPEADGAVPVVVLVPGGGWSSADPRGLQPLARRLAASGAVAATTTYRTAGDGGTFPVAVQDVLCAAAAVVAEAERAGRTGGPLVLVGHSAGAHLALLAALRPHDLRGECAHPAVEPDAVAGLAGPYDVRAMADVAVNLFGVSPEADPQRWREGSPLSWTGERPDVPVLLVHGEADDVVPVSQTRGAATVLRAGGHDVQMELLPGVDHLDVFAAEVAGPVLEQWLSAVVVR
jgi:acetyl esterase/lipase